jgi:hypothetical protein
MSRFSSIDHIVARFPRCEDGGRNAAGPGREQALCDHTEIASKVNCSVGSFPAIGQREDKKGGHTTSAP